jgi:hypothetical protein
MTGPEPPEQPYLPQFRVPPMTPVQPGGLDDPEARRRRMRMGIIGAAVGIGIPIIIIAVAVVIGLTTGTSGTTGSDQWIGAMLVLLGGTVLASPIQIIAGIVLTAIANTRPFGVGLLIGAAVGAIIMAGTCFTLPTVTG